MVRVILVLKTDFENYMPLVYRMGFELSQFYPPTIEPNAHLVHHVAERGGNRFFDPNASRIRFHDVLLSVP
jgi:hypothetical protein